MLPLTGYTDRLSAPPGGRIAFKVSSTFEGPYEVDVVRIIHADPNPDGPGLKLREVKTDIDGSYPSRYQPVHLGSYGEVDDHPALHGLQAFTVGAVVWPTLPDRPAQAVLSKWDAGSGFSLEIDAEGGRIVVGDGHGGSASVGVGKRARRHAWYRLWASYDPQTRKLAVSQQPLKPQVMSDDAGTASVVLKSTPPLDTAGPLLIAARRDRLIAGHFNGKIESPFILATASPDDTETAFAGGTPQSLLAHWDFSKEISSTRIHDAGPNELEGRLVNLPARGMVGSNWTGAEMCFRHAPEQYGAIHFHEDDLYDCGWEDDFALEIPEDMPSGAYGARLRSEHAEDIIPFYVRPATGKPTSSAVFLAPTFTYQVYANHARDTLDHSFRERMRIWGASPDNPDDHPDYAHSTYNLHTDGSGVCTSSRLRPIMTMRPNFLTIDDPRGSGVRHFPADTHLIDWLDAMGHDVDIVTDEDLDDIGVDLIRPYKVVLTGSHPEYHTKGTLDALQSYTGNGGRLIYLGGNGFYWRVARNADLPGVLEIRRTEGGIRTWAAEPGEYFNAFDGTYGGLWRRNGRPPQLLAGVGFSAQGLFESSYYRRKPGGDDARAAWILEGVDEEILGNFGLSAGGAAGFELDRADVRLGTPEHALVIASSENHQPSFIAVLEDQLNQRATYTGVPHQQLIRADIVYFKTPNGGAVFSVGSITFCGSLSHQNYDNNISKMIDNVLKRFRS